MLLESGVNQTHLVTYVMLRKWENSWVASYKWPHFCPYLCKQCATDGMEFLKGDLCEKAK